MAEKYRNFSKAVLEIQKKKLSIRQASTKYGIPRTTLGDHTKGRHIGKHGKRPAFSEHEEKIIVEHLLSEDGFPFSKFDVRVAAKHYLDKCGKTVKSFKNNFPGVDWAENFIRRNPVLSTRMSRNNIPPRRAKTQDRSVSPPLVQEETEIITDKTEVASTSIGWTSKPKTAQKRKSDSEFCNITATTTEEDELDMFAKTVANKLRCMNKIQRLCAENVINQALFKGLLNQLTPESVIVNQPTQALAYSTVQPTLTETHDMGRETPDTKEFIRTGDEEYGY